jgi:hypothetical protein
MFLRCGRPSHEAASTVVAAEGTHDELLATSERYREVLAQAAAIEAATTVDAAS